MVTNARSDDSSLEEDLFLRARSIRSATDRAAFLDRACDGDALLHRRVVELLRADHDAGLFLAATPPRELEGPGSLIGRYRLTRLLGAGGGGEVFLAQHQTEDLPPCALKLVKAGMDTRQVVARFEIERRSLARMNHPNIARIFDAGVAPSGRPFFVMEWVDGLPIVTYARMHRLTVRQRLALFHDVCLAVQHAHQKGVIHRDIKPSNVLVTEVDGTLTPKVIDFGIAKAIQDDLDVGEPLTHQGLLIGTPQYMSPEQAGIPRFDVDSRADIYSLGVVLFELLTDTTPLDATGITNRGVDEIRRAVDASVTPRPSLYLKYVDARNEIAANRRTVASQLIRLLQHDLDWVILKALEHDRDRRYATAWEFAQDVQRILDDEPVVAGPPERLYQIRKFVRRNRIPVALSLTLVATLLLAVIGTTVGLLEADGARADLEATNARLNRVVKYQSARLSQIDLPAMGRAFRAQLFDQVGAGLRRGGRDEASVAAHLEQLDRLLSTANLTTIAGRVASDILIDAAERAIDRDFEDEPTLQATLLHSLAQTLHDIGLLERGLTTARRALAIRTERLGRDRVETVNSTFLVASLMRQLNRLDEAWPLAKDALVAFQETYGADHDKTMDALNNVAMTHVAAGDWGEAESKLIEVLTRTVSRHGSLSLDAIKAHNNLGAFFEQRGRIDEATTHYREALELARALDADEATLVASNNLGSVLANRGELDAAEELVRFAFVGTQQRYGDDHPKTIAAANALGIILLRKNNAADALALLRRAHAGFQRVIGGSHRTTLACYGNVGVALRLNGELEESERVLANVVARARDAFPTDHPVLGGMLMQHGTSIANLARFAEAEEELLRGWEMIQRSAGDASFQSQQATQTMLGFYEGWDTIGAGNHRDDVERWRGILSSNAKGKGKG